MLVLFETWGVKMVTQRRKIAARGSTAALHALNTARLMGLQCGTLVSRLDA